VRRALTGRDPRPLPRFGARHGVPPPTEWTCPRRVRRSDAVGLQLDHLHRRDTIADFEAACGVRVIYDTYPSDDDMLARMRQGNPGYDVAVPSDRIVAMMARRTCCCRSTASAAELANVDPTFLDLDFDPGNRYSIPYQWGTLGIGYHVGRSGFEITSGWTCSRTTVRSAGSRTSAR
jgi:hypothetical protein